MLRDSCRDGAGKASTVLASPEWALITCYGTPGQATASFLLHSENGLVFSSRDHTHLVRSYGLKRASIKTHRQQPGSPSITNSALIIP